MLMWQDYWKEGSWDSLGLVCFTVCLWMLNLNLVHFVPVQVNVKVTHSQLPTLVIGYMAKANRSLWDIFGAYVYIVSMPIVKKTSGHTSMPLHKATTPHCMVTWLNVDWCTWSEWTILFLLTLSVRIAGNNARCNLMTRVVESENTTITKQ